MGPKVNDKIEEIANDLSISAAHDLFENQFMSQNLEIQIMQCEKYKLVNYFKKWLPEHQPILEAGCGSGRWVGWFVKNGLTATGLDWSEKLCERARKNIPGARFEVGDMRDMPFNDKEFGAIVSLGAIEHSIEGPIRSLKEFYRVLRPQGIAIISVPYLGPIRKIKRFCRKPKTIIEQSCFFRKLLGKSNQGNKISDVKREKLAGFSADFVFNQNGWDFYEYQFTKSQMEAFIKKVDLVIIDEFIEFGDEGILYNLGRIVGFYDYDNERVSLNVLGKIIQKLIPNNLVGHMLCFLVQKNQ